MHMADALISPAVGGTMWLASAGMIAWCSREVRTDLDERRVPLMGVLGAFVFAAQMINFTIPATGSSGHLGGGLLLAILLGPHAAVLSLASVLMVQALFFADGGLLALGCNIFNLGILPAFVAYPYIYRKIVGDQPTAGKIAFGATVAAVAGLQLGAVCVVLETVASGVSSLPFSTFVVLMQPIHLAIGVAEGLVTEVVISAVGKVRPEILHFAGNSGSWPVRRVAVGFLVVALLIGGLVSRIASEKPDGLEWSIKKMTGREEVAEAADGVHLVLATLQERLALFSGDEFKSPARGVAAPEVAVPGAKRDDGANVGISVAGMVGSLLTLAVALVIGIVLRKKSSAT